MKCNLHDNFVIAIDSTRIKVSFRDERIKKKGDLKNPYLKVRIAVDIRRKFYAYWYPAVNNYMIP